LGLLSVAVVQQNVRYITTERGRGLTPLRSTFRACGMHRGADHGAQSGIIMAGNHEIPNPRMGMHDSHREAAPDLPSDILAIEEQAVDIIEINVMNERAIGPRCRRDAPPHVWIAAVMHQYDRGTSFGAVLKAALDITANTIFAMVAIN